MKPVRIRTTGISNWVGPRKFYLNSVEGDVHVFLRSDKEVVLWADFSDEVTIPLVVGKEVEQLYHFESNILSLRIETQKSTAYALRIRQAGTAYRDVVDPTPKRAVVPLDNASDTMENRILKAVDQALSARGLSAGKPRGTDYDEGDEEFGSGYEYDEDVDAEIDASAVRAVAAKFAPAKKPAGKAETPPAAAEEPLPEKVD